MAALCATQIFPRMQYPFPAHPMKLRPPRRLDGAGRCERGIRPDSTTMPGAIPPSRTTSRVRRVPVTLPRWGVCIRVGSDWSIAITSWPRNASSSTGVIEKQPSSPTGTPCCAAARARTLVLRRRAHRCHAFARGRGRRACAPGQRCEERGVHSPRSRRHPRRHTALQLLPKRVCADVFRPVLLGCRRDQLGIVTAESVVDQREQ